MWMCDVTNSSTESASTRETVLGTPVGSSPARDVGCGGAGGSGVQDRVATEVVLVTLLQVPSRLHHNHLHRPLPLRYVYYKYCEDPL